MSIVVNQMVHVKPCARHLKHPKSVPACFQNWGGPYEVIRPLKWGMMLLRHIPSQYMGLVDADAIVALPAAQP